MSVEEIVGLGEGIEPDLLRKVLKAIVLGFPFAKVSTRKATDYLDFNKLSYVERLPNLKKSSQFPSEHNNKLMPLSYRHTIIILNCPVNDKTLLISSNKEA